MYVLLKFLLAVTSLLSYLNPTAEHTAAGNELYVKSYI